jgi:hypothetical protein
VHETWGGARLCFVRLGFHVYDRDDVLRILSETLREVHSCAFVVYEILGDYDLLVRVWLPREVTQIRLEEVLATRLALSGVDPSRVRVSLVETVLRHWVFERREGPVAPADARLERLPTEDFRNRLNSTLTDGPNTPGTLTEAEVQTLIGEGIIGELVNGDELDAGEAGVPGLKFATLIRTDTLSQDARRRLRRAVQGQVDALAVLTDEQNRPVVRELSLYWMPGQADAEFVIMGRIRPESFHRALDDLISFVVDTGMRAFGAHPTTYIFASENYRLIEEALPTSAAAETVALDQRPIAELLAAPEDSRIEFKGSVYIDVDKWLYAGGAPQVSEELFLDGVVRTVAAFLNSPMIRSGRLVLGAYEITPAVERARASSAEAVQVRFADLPEVGRCLVVGVEPDIQALKRQGTNVGDVDGLMRHVAQRLDSILQVSGRSTGALAEVEVTATKVAERTVLVIEVETVAPRGWVHFLDPENVETFTVRRGNRSVNLSRDEEMDWRSRWDR